MEHRRTRSGDQSAKQNSTERFDIAHACHTQSGQEHAERHEPRAGLPVADPPEQRLDDSGRDVRNAQHECHMGVGIPSPGNQERQDGGKRTLIHVAAQMADHSQIVGKLVAVLLLH